jgi:WD40 repeat protein
LSTFSRALAWSSDGTHLLAGLYPRSIQWWAPGANQPSRQLEFHPAGKDANMPWAWFSPDASMVAIPWWDSDEFIDIYDLRDGSLSGKIRGLSHGSARAAWSPDGEWLAASGSEQAILLFKKGNWMQPRLLRGPMGLTAGLAFSDSSHLISVSGDHTARWWTVPPKTTAPLYPNDMTGSHVWRPVWSPDGTMVTLASRFGINFEDRLMQGVLWDVAKKAPRFQWNEIGLAFSPDSRRILTVERNKVYRVRDTAGGQEIRQFTLQHDGGFRLPRVSPDGRWMVVWHQPDAGLLYDMTTAASVAELTDGREAAFSPDSRLLARESGRKLVLRDLATGTERSTDVPCHLAIAWSPDGGTIATRFDTSVHLVDAKSGTLKATLASQSARLGVMLFLPDGRTLLTTGEDGAIRLWNLPTRRESVTLANTGPCVYYCAASPDGRSILAGGVQGYSFFTLSPETSLTPVTPPVTGPSAEHSLWRE